MSPPTPSPDPKKKRARFGRPSKLPEKRAKIPKLPLAPPELGELSAEEIALVLKARRAKK